MSEKNNKPHFISNTPCGEDRFKNKPHESIADVLYTIVTNKSEDNKNIENKIIGLEGKWGSGKSNTLEILGKKLKKDEIELPIFNYDIWGHQEDLTRQSFLEEIIEWALTNKIKLKKDSKLNDINDKISAKFKKTNTKFFPKIKILYIWVSLIPIINLGINWIDSMIGKDNSNFVFNIIRFVITCILLVFSYISIKSDVKKYKEKNENKYDNNDKFRKLKYNLDAISSALYFLSGEHSETKVDECILEDEPSVKRFKSIFSEFLNSLDIKGLIIVFDNMDRLSNSDKLMSIWSSINTFFSEIKVNDSKDTNSLRVFTIIPYDKDNLSKLMAGENSKKDSTFVNNFINKTFFVSLYVPIPIFDNWKIFFLEKFKSAFNNVEINENEIDLVENLFSYKYKQEITPRLIINFINDLVALKLIKPLIEIKYLAVYSLLKDEIKENPSIMITFSKFEEYRRFLDDNDEEKITKKLASIFYNIDEEEAKKILYESLTLSQLENKTDEFDNLIKDKSFWDWFKVTIGNNSLKNYKFDNLIKLFIIAKNTYPQSSAFISFSSKILDSISDYDKYDTEQDKFIDGLIDRYIKKYFAIMYKIIKDTNNFDIENYCLFMNKVYDLSNSKGKHYLTIKEQKIDIENYINIYFEHKKSDQIYYFNNYKFILGENELEKYFFNNNLYKKENFDKIQIIEYISNNSNSINLENFNVMNKHILTNIIHTSQPSNTIELIEGVLKINRWINKERIEQISTTVNIYNKYIALKGNILITNSDIIGLVLLYSTNHDGVSSFTQIVNISDISEEDTLVILNYVTFSQILELLIKNNIPILKALIKNIIDYDLSNDLNLSVVFNNIQALYSNVGEEIFSFLKYFDEWESNFDYDASEYTDLYNWKELITNDNLKDYKCITLVYKYYIKLFKKYTSDDWIKSISNKDEIYKVFDNLLRKDLIDKGLINEKVFYDSIFKLIEEYIQNEIEIDIEFFELIIARLSKKYLKYFAPKVYDFANATGYSQFDNNKIKFIFNFLIHNINEKTDWDLLLDNYLIPIINKEAKYFIEMINADKEAWNSLVYLIKNYNKEIAPLFDALQPLDEDLKIKELLDLLDQKREELSQNYEEN